MIDLTMSPKIHASNVTMLALAAGRKRQSPRTGFVHCFPGDERVVDTIPVYENVCFALSLFRQKTSESVLEGRALLERLLAFQTEDGNFPAYLHEFPKCRDSSMFLKVAPLLVQIMRRFGSLLGVELKEKMARSIELAIQFAADKEWAPVWKHRYQALCNQSSHFSPSSQEEWFEWIVSKQLLEEDIGEVPYDRTLQVFLGGMEFQEKGEPAVWPIEWALAESDGFSKRLLRDCAAMIRASALFPFEHTSLTSSDSYSVISAPQGVRWLWKGEQIHTLSVPNAHLCGDELQFVLSGPADCGKGALVETALFCNLSPETNVLIEGVQGTIFRLGDRIQIIAGAKIFEVQFHLVEGEGDFVGHISRANRPAQTAAKGDLRYEVFDWQIGIRTLRRSSECRLIARYSLTSLALL